MNKNLIKASYILGFIFGAIECCTIILLIPGIVSIVGALQIKNIYEMNEKKILDNMDKLFIWGIVLSFLCLPCGVLLLIFYIIEQRKILK